MTTSWVNILLRPAMASIAWTDRRKLLNATRNVEQAQLDLLQTIIRTNVDTRFGQDHNFSAITDWDGFRRNVPIQTYESLERYISEQIKTQNYSLVGMPLVSLARTSGTTGPTKDIPMTAHGLQAIRDAQRQLALSLYRDTRFFDGRILALFSPHVEGRLKEGLAYGSSSGQANRNTPPLFRSKYVYPDEIAALRDYDLKYYLYALFGILEQNVTGIATANPSSVSRIADIIEDRRAQLVSDLKAADISHYAQLSSTNIPKRFVDLCHSNQKRREDLMRLLATTDDVPLARFWPNLSAVAVWTGGSCVVALETLRRLVPAGTKFVEIGYRASEFVGSVNICANTNTCLPTVHHTVFEFCEQKAWEDDRPEFTHVSELEEGVNYYVFVTTSSGLYRYNINDIVQAGQKHQGCPSIRFLQKGKGITSITGEKLYVHQALQAVTGTQHKLGVDIKFCLLLADVDSANYRALVEIGDRETDFSEKFAETLDDTLQTLNSEYADKRKSGRLKPMQVSPVKLGTGEAIKRQALANGQREAQYKPPCLEYASQFDFDFMPWLES